MTRWRVEVLRAPDARPGYIEEFDSYELASGFAHTWPLSDVRISKIVEVAYFKGNGHEDAGQPG